MLYFSPMSIRFGTSGWRALFADEFTFDNVRKLTHVISGHIKENLEFGFFSPEYGQHAGAGMTSQPPLVVIGYDTRFFSEEFAREAAEVFAAGGIRVFLASSETPTPALAWAVIEHKAVGGVVITASHNPAQYNGCKWTPYWGGPAIPAVTEDIERRLALLSQHAIRTMPYEKAIRDGWIVRMDMRGPYFKKLRGLLDLKRIKSAKLKIGVDPLYGAARRYLKPFLEEAGAQVMSLHEDRDVLFGGRSSEPSPEVLGDLIGLVKSKKLDLGLSCDGDADRFGILDAGGVWIPPNDVLALALHHLVANRGLKGGVARSLMTSHFVDAVAKSHGLRVRETPVGFKYIGDLLRGGGFLLGGEESGGLSIAGHVPEKDGPLACLLMAELVAFEGKPLAKVREQLHKKHGEFHNVRVNFHLENLLFARELNDRLKLKPPTTLGGSSVWRIDETDGFKFVLKDGRWLGLRLSGTEPVVRLYAEAFSKKDMDVLVGEGKKMIFGRNGGKK
ncbi:MAG: phosphoglucomutase/phosphomannomutase family protein [Elusimicrobia bacterium]|nr:phosphoglucomutase/phosphomannomutase family protein [Elusimicrobiota bacterium]